MLIPDDACNGGNHYDTNHCCAFGNGNGAVSVGSKLPPSFFPSFAYCSFSLRVYTCWRSPDLRSQLVSRELRLPSFINMFRSRSNDTTLYQYLSQKLHIHTLQAYAITFDLTCTRYTSLCTVKRKFSSLNEEATAGYKPGSN